jgi:hypothetical protein
MCQRKANRDLEHCLSATYGINARPAPNLQNRKSLNFQEKIERKSKVSKPSDVENVETVEAGEATRMATISRKVSRDSWTSTAGVEFLGGGIFLAICGQNSRVPFIPGCRDPRVT